MFLEGVGKQKNAEEAQLDMWKTCTEMPRVHSYCQMHRSEPLIQQSRINLNTGI